MCVCVFTQLCPTLCDPMDYSPPGSSVNGISQVRTLSVLPFPPPGIFSTQKLNPCLPPLLHCRWISYPMSHWGNMKTNFLTLHLRKMVSQDPTTRRQLLVKLRTELTPPNFCSIGFFPEQYSKFEVSNKYKFI